MLTKKNVLSCLINDQTLTTKLKTKLAKCIKLTKVKSLGEKGQKLMKIVIFLKLSPIFLPIYGIEFFLHYLAMEFYGPMVSVVTYLYKSMPIF